ncbi:MAG: DUF2304 domain-containing protein [Halioglobus sp.]
MISLVTGTIGLLVAGLIILLMRKDRLHANHGLGWILVAIGFALLGFSPGIFDNIAKYFGVSYPPMLALTFGVAILVIKILLMDIERSRIEVRNQRLVQRVAMLEADLHEGLKAMNQAAEPTADRAVGNNDAKRD